MKKGGVLVLSLIFLSCISHDKKQVKLAKNETKVMINKDVEIATFGGGCFWCTEAIFDQLEGVSKVESGYSGGQTKNPTYREISTGLTGHAEVIHITFDPNKITFDELLDIFFNTHNPTTLNRQGADVGTQYRSGVFYHNNAQKKAAIDMIAALEKDEVFEDKIVTEVTVFDVFYVAENYHQDYFQNNRSQGYCQVVINPKYEKFRKQYKDKLKK